jgi:hypothetical protein
MATTKEARHEKASLIDIYIHTYIHTYIQLQQQQQQQQQYSILSDSVLLN